MSIRGAIDDTIHVMEQRLRQAKKLGRLTFYSQALGHDHIHEMYLEILAMPMSEDKLSRWLGWIQCAICSWGILSLDEIKDINKRHF